MGSQTKEYESKKNAFRSADNDGEAQYYFARIEWKLENKKKLKEENESGEKSE